MSEETDRERRVWQCRICHRKAVRADWSTYRGSLCCGRCLIIAGPDTLEPCDDPDQTAEHTPLDLCNNGTCRTPQVPDCSNQFCAHCCEEKCDGRCERALLTRIGPDRVPQF